MKIGKPVKSSTVSRINTGVYGKYDTIVEAANELKDSESLPVTFDDKKQAVSASISLNRRGLNVKRRGLVLYISLRKDR